MAKKKLSLPKTKEEMMIIDVHAVGEGIAPIFNYDAWVGDPKKIPRSAKRKFRKMWRTAEKWLELDRNPPCWYRTFNKSKLVTSYLVEKNKKK